LALTATGCTLSDVEDKLRFGWPRGITDQAERMRVLWTWSWVAAFVVGALVWGLIFYSIIFFRKKDDELPRQTKYNLPIETIYTVLPFLIISVLFYYTAVTENFVNKETKNPDTSVQVVAFKWNWQFDYLDKKDPTSSGAGEFVNTVGSPTEIPILVLPVGQTIRIYEKSNDVIHSFWVPEFLFKRDVVPGLDNSFEITIKPNQTGAYVGRCAELCGTYHSMMNFEVRAVSPQDYRTYLDTLASLGGTDPNRQAEALAAIGQPTKAVTTYPFDTKRTERAASQPPSGD
jgi:cytochrome c oxidase, subunit II